MSALEAVQGQKPAVSLKVNQAMVAGRVDNVRRLDVGGRPVFEHRVILPAQDAFTSPGAIQVRASYQLGKPGDDITAHVAVSGWRDKFTDKTSGEMIQTARVSLTVVE